MSFRRKPFQFSDFNADDRRSEFLRRFGIQPEEDNMFETSPPLGPSWAEWPGRFHRPGFHDDLDWRDTGHVFGNSGSAPGSPHTRSNMRMPPGWPREKEDGIPIKVVHERTGSRHEGDDSTESETSSQGSRSSCSSNGGSSKKRYESRREPRVYHIPITVEPRDGSTSSGYASDSTSDESKQNNCKAPVNVNGNLQSQDQSEKVGPSGESASPLNAEGSSPTSPTEKKPSTSTQKVNVIPVQVEVNEPTSKMSENVSGEPSSFHEKPSWTSNLPLFKNKENPAGGSGSKPARSSSGSISGQGQKTDTGKATSASTTDINQEKTKPPAPAANDPKEQIKKIRKEVSDLKAQVLNFSGNVQDKQYRFLDEMLTRCILKLDGVETGGAADVRQIRKAAITETQGVITMLEDKVRALIEAEDSSVIQRYDGSDQSYESDMSGMSGTMDDSFYSSTSGGQQSEEPTGEAAMDETSNETTKL